MARSGRRPFLTRQRRSLGPSGVSSRSSGRWVCRRTYLKTSSSPPTKRCSIVCAAGARLYLEGCAPTVPRNLLASSGIEVIVGAPSDAVCSTARRLAADLIVIGSHGYGGNRPAPRDHRREDRCSTRSIHFVSRRFPGVCGGVAPRVPPERVVPFEILRPQEGVHGFASGAAKVAAGSGKR
jgi:hypothetical protein